MLQKHSGSDAIVFRNACDLHQQVRTTHRAVVSNSDDQTLPVSVANSNPILPSPTNSLTNIPRPSASEAPESGLLNTSSNKAVTSAVIVGCSTKVPAVPSTERRVYSKPVAPPTEYPRLQISRSKNEAELKKQKSGVIHNEPARFRCPSVCLPEKQTQRVGSMFRSRFIWLPPQNRSLRFL